MINGDSATFKVKVLVQDKKLVYGDDNQILSSEWITTEVLRLDNPGQLQTKYLTSTRRLIIEEDGNL